MNNFTVIIAAVIVSSLIVFSIAVNQVFLQKPSIKFEDALNLYEKLRHGHSITLSFDTMVYEKKHVLSVCFEKGCRNIPFSQTIVLIPSLNPPIYGNETLVCDTYFNLHANKTYVILSSCIMIKEYDNTIVLYYVKPSKEGKYTRFIFSEGLEDNIVIYVRNARLLIDNVEIKQLTGFKTIILQPILILP